jgi:anaerobic selenocysteine-containing dehydrogenase
MLATFVGKPDTPCADVTPDEARAKLATEPGSERMLDLMLRSGPYGDAFDDDAEGLSLAKLAAVPHAVDLGPLEPRLPEMIRKPDRRLNLVHPILEQDVQRLRAGLGERRDPERMVLVGRRQMRNMNSWLHNLQNLAKGPERCTLLVNPVDAERLGLDPGGVAKLTGRAGSLTVPIEVTDEMMPGVVSLPHGFGHRESDTRQSTARGAQPGANSNLLCDEYAMDVPSQTSVANGIPVRVSPV